MRFFSSVRTRVTLGAIAVFAIALVLIGLGILRLVSGTLIEDAERIAEVQARNLAIAAELGRLNTPLGVDSGGTVVLQVVSAEGEVVAASSQLQNMPQLLGTLPPSGITTASTVRIIPTSGIATDYRVVGIGTESPSGSIAVIAGVSLEDAEATLATLGTSLITGFSAMLVIVAGIVWAVISRALRPVDKIRTEVEQISEADLTRRVPTGLPKDELHRLAVTMNTMLDRLQASSQKQREFIADASHELRSPLASLRTQLEVAVAHPDGTGVAEVAADALTDVTRLQDLTEDLLLLTRLDAAVPARREPLDLSEVISSLLARHTEGRIPVLFTPGPTASVQAHRGQIERLLTNLIDNAVRHGSTQVQVTCAAGRVVTVEVNDDGPGIDPADREHIFERFVRLDSPRARSEGGTGLGLSIAREIARAHGGDLSVADSPSGAHFVLTLPGMGS